MPDFIWPPFIGPLAHILPTYLVIFGGYLMGSIPFGLVLTRASGLGDIRHIGSGNIGATNVLRTGNKALALTTLLLDGGKGSLAVVLAHWAVPNLVYLAALAVFLGHLYPVWLNFRGGKGVATFLGIELALFWPIGLACCLTWLVAALIFRYSSLAALAAAALAPLFALLFGFPALAGLSFLLATVVFFRHAPNIRRLTTGTEPRIGGKK